MTVAQVVLLVVVFLVVPAVIVGVVEDWRLGALFGACLSAMAGLAVALTVALHALA